MDEVVRLEAVSQRFVRRWALAHLSLAVPRATAHPVRVFSANQCIDQIILALLPPERIASVTWLSRDGAAGPVARAAQRVGVNHGLVEQFYSF